MQFLVKTLFFDLYLNSGKTSIPIFGEDHFYFGLHLICSHEKNRGRGSSLPMLKINPTNARKVDVKADVKLKTLENAYNKKNCWLFKIKLNVRATAQTSLQGRIIFCFPEYDIKKFFFDSSYSTYNKLVF